MAFWHVHAPNTMNMLSTLRQAATGHFLNRYTPICYFECVTVCDYRPWYHIHTQTHTHTHTHTSGVTKRALRSPLFVVLTQLAKLTATPAGGHTVNNCISVARASNTSLVSFALAAPALVVVVCVRRSLTIAVFHPLSSNH